MTPPFCSYNILDIYITIAALTTRRNCVTCYLKTFQCFPMSLKRKAKILRTACKFLTFTNPQPSTTISDLVSYNLPLESVDFCCTAPGLLHLLFLLSEAVLSQISIWLAPELPSSYIYRWSSTYHGSTFNFSTLQWSKSDVYFDLFPG